MSLLADAPLGRPFCSLISSRAVSSRSLVHVRRALNLVPVLFRLPDRARTVLLELVEDSLIQEYVELAIFDRGETRITIELLGNRNAERAEAAELRQVAGWRLLEGLLVRFA